jgi:hypothetical protein
MMRRWIVTVALLCTLGVAVPPARAGSFSSDAGIGVACVFVNLLYMPAKLVYATLGGITGGFAYLLTGLNSEVADKVWTPSLGGNYVVTPAHLRNEQTLYFSGTVEEEPSNAAAPGSPGS